MSRADDPERYAIDFDRVRTPGSAAEMSRAGDASNDEQSAPGPSRDQIRAELTTMPPWALVAETRRPDWTAERGHAIEDELRARIGELSGYIAANLRLAYSEDLRSGVAEVVELDQVATPLLQRQTEVFAGMSIGPTNGDRHAVAHLATWYAEAFAAWKRDLAALHEVTTRIRKSAESDMHLMGGINEAVQTAYALDKAAAVGVGAAVAAPAAAGYGAALAGAALVGGAMQSVDETDERPLLERTISGAETGVIQEMGGKLGGDLGGRLKVRLNPAPGEAAASAAAESAATAEASAATRGPVATAVRAALPGMVEGGVAMGAYSAGDAAAHGKSLSQIATAGVMGTLGGALFGTVMNLGGPHVTAEGREVESNGGGASGRPGESNASAADATRAAETTATATESAANATASAEVSAATAVEPARASTTKAGAAANSEAATAVEPVTTHAERAETPRAVPLASAPPVEIAAPRVEIAEILRGHQERGATIEPVARDAAGRRSYDVAYPDGRRLHVVEDLQADALPGAGVEPPTPAQAALAREAADRAAEIQARRDAQLTALIQASDEPIVASMVIGGSGQGGTLAHATQRGGVGAAPGIDLAAIPDAFNIAPEGSRGSMFANHGDFPIGQAPPELRGPDEIRQPGEFTHEHGKATAASDYVRSLTMTGYDTGMVTYKATVTQVDVRPPEGWGDGVPAAAAEMSIRITAGGKQIYTRYFISAGGLGPPAPLPLAGVGNAAELAASGRLVYAQESLTLPHGGRTVIVVGDGTTGAWAAEAAIKNGATKVYWVGNGPKPFEIPPEQVATLTELGMNSEQIATFWRANNARNAPTFEYIKAGMVELQPNKLKDAVLIPETNRVRATLADGSPLEVDGIVVAAGQRLELPAGLRDVGDTIVLKMVKVGDGVSARVVALDVFDKATGAPIGIRIEGAQMFKASTLLVGAEKRAFEQQIIEQTTGLDVPKDSRGIPGAIYQTNIDVPLANQTLPGDAQ
ncbi:MAG: hypothetical protein K8W52_46105 [Deltaproteobacteria bacterium]|nr:hypothetical protein [Deltaproteobacteria bacterium]